MSGFSLTVRGGFAAGAGNGALLRQIVGAAADAAAEQVARGVRATSPVKTGALRDSWRPVAASWQGTTLRSGISSDRPYAHYQNTRTRNAGYIERGLELGRPAALGELRGGLESLVGALWENGGR